MDRTRRYVIAALAIAVVGVVAVAALNAFVDPLALWSPVHGTIAHTNVQEGGGRLFKSERLARGDWQAVIFGSSRCLRGVDPDNPAFAGQRAFNACLSGTNMAETAKVIAFARSHNPQLHTVIISIDFEMFARQRETAGDFDASRMSGKPWLEVVANYLLSFDTLELSLATLFDNARRRPADMKENGFVDWTVDPPKGTVRRHFDGMLVQNYLVDADNYGAFVYAADRIERLRHTLDALHAAHIDVRLFIPPIHARQMEAILDLGLPYKTWLRDVARVADQTHTPLTDFSGYNTITTEPLPPMDSKAPMRWYWESSHFRREVGDMILGVLFGHRTADTPADFGNVLTSQTVEADIAALHNGRARYAATQPIEAQTVAKFVKQTEARRRYLRRLLGR